MKKAAAYIVSVIFFVLFGYILWETYQADNFGFESKSFWEWMELLVVPAALAAAGFWFSRIQKQTELEIAEKEREVDREIALERQRQQTLENYLDRMKELILDRGLGHEAKPEVKKFARVLTLNVLRELESERNRQVVQFLQEGKLLGEEQAIDLKRANLSRVNLGTVNLRLINLSGADLIMTNLSGADLREADLSGADLIMTDLNVADLREADLSGADLRDAYLFRTNLRGAILRKVILSETDLSEAYLERADLSKANLREAIVTDRQLSQAVFSDNTIMPDGRLYKEWKKERGEGEQGDTFVFNPTPEEEEE